MRARLGLAAFLASLVALASASAATASTTIGQLAPTSTTPACNAGPIDFFNQTVTSGTGYVVPAGGVAVTSWSTFVPAGAGQMLVMKVFRKIGEPGIYQVVGHDGPRQLTPVGVNTFPVNIAVKPGDVLGLNDSTATTATNTCLFSVPGEISPFERVGDLADGGAGNFIPTGDADNRLNVSAVVGFEPSNAFSFGKLKRNTNAGTAVLKVNVPGPGKLELTGKGVKPQRQARASALVSKTVAAAGTVKLAIKPKSKVKKKLNDQGTAKVKVKITYTPDGTATGDVVGDPKTQTKRVKLVKKT
jgi:hypothetical protein